MPHMSWKHLLRIEAGANVCIWTMSVVTDEESWEGSETKEGGGKNYVDMVGEILPRAFPASDADMTCRLSWLGRYCFQNLASGHETSQPSLAIVQACLWETCCNLRDGRQASNKWHATNTVRQKLLANRLSVAFIRGDLGEPPTPPPPSSPSSSGGARLHLKHRTLGRPTSTRIGQLAPDDAHTKVVLVEHPEAEIEGQPRSSKLRAALPTVEEEDSTDWTEEKDTANAGGSWFDEKPARPSERTDKTTTPAQYLSRFMKDQSFMSEESESAWVDDESTWNDGISAEASGDAADFGWQKSTNDARGVGKAADRLYITDHGTYRVRMDMSSDNIVKG